MIVLKVFETDHSEEDLLCLLVGRGRQADVPLYFSVDNYELMTGIVSFVRLDHAPAQGFRVAVAGQNLVISARDEREVLSWLHEWNVSFREIERHEVPTPEEVRGIISQLHRKTTPKEGRANLLKRVRRRIRAQATQEDTARFD